MKTAVVLMLSMAAISCAQDKKAENNSQNRAEEKTAGQPGEKKRLDSVTWDLKNHKLVWVIQTGAEQNGEFVAKRSDRYEIMPDKAVMAFADEKRGFTEEEAASLHKLLDTLSLYCAESVIWWDQGEGERLDGTPGQRRTRPRNQTPDPGRKQRVEQVEPPSVPAGTLVAQTQ